jgi:DNA helicase-2/ATP-dependent DNA helicase PcrA
MESENIYLHQLNDNQTEAVTYCDGPALVVAGAGSGKTRVLTYKIAHLLQQGLPPYHILALTFTNKAAREMKNRIASLTDESLVQQLWMGTFHSIFYRILRYEAAAIGYAPAFTIYDSADSKNLIRSIIKEMQLDDKTYPCGLIQSRISNAKNALITHHAYELKKEMIEYDRKARIPLFSEIYNRYQARCAQAGVMDFDELLLQTNLLFRDHPEVLAKYQDKFRYVLVDEYQDTNFSQHLIVTRLSEKHRRICVVGDDAQSIYSFRGANIDNMLRFKDQYPDCRIFKLERNYRSTQNIVNAANSLIKKNKGQIPKTVYSENEPGSKVCIYHSYSDYEESYLVASQIAELRLTEQCSYADFAVLYRTNAQSRLIEEALRRKNIAYKVYGSQSFYQRKEIKDIIAYFHVIVNPHNEEALKRIINFPHRGIGNTTLNKLFAAATTFRVSVWEAMCSPMDYNIQDRVAKKISEFRDLIQELIAENQQRSAIEMAELAVQRSGIATFFCQDQSLESISKQEHLQEIMKAIAEFCAIRREEGSDRISLSDFLIEVSLLTDQDNDGGNENADKVTLMTVHAAKGLEFDNVLVSGMEENLFPSLKGAGNPHAIEEERRLFYVALTRARKRCVVTYAKNRFLNGQTGPCVPSRFLRDIDPQYVNYSEDKHEEASPLSFSVPYYLKKVETVDAPPVAEKVNSLGGFWVGDEVHHRRFGRGEIISLEGSGGDARAKILFEHLGHKNLLLKYAQLTVIKEASHD